MLKIMLTQSTEAYLNLGLGFWRPTARITNAALSAVLAISTIIIPVIYVTWSIKYLPVLP